MRWRGRRGSSNVQDRRGAGPLAVGGGVGALVVALVAMLFGVDPGVVLQGGGADGPAGPGAPPPADDPTAQFVSVVLADTEEVWQAWFRDQLGQDYPEPTLVLFSGGVQSACGFAQSAVGPFYCPADRQLYLDLSFFRELQQRLGAPGDFAQAYVVAHEVGHHVQTVLGISDEVRARSRGLREAEANALSVRQELQADCFAGVWASRAQAAWNILEPGDIREALGAAAAVGDDRLQSRGAGEVVPETFTHGTSEQRMRWFSRGAETGDPAACDTFAEDAA